MMTAELLSELLLKHLQGRLSAAEEQQLNHWVQQSPGNLRLFTMVTDEEQLRTHLQFYQEAQQHEQSILQQIQRKRVRAPVQPAVKRMRLPAKRLWAAAAVLLFMGLGAYLWSIRIKEAVPGRELAKTDIPPGKEGAILTLADGRQVVLDSLGNGIIAVQDGAGVVLKNGELLYTGSKSAGAMPVYNTLTTPKGRQFQLSLPDGTRVWLNAASSIQYPAVFTEKERRVIVTGEAYFEVAANSALPFKVVTAKTEVNVLGTDFNINAYTDESMDKTTLLNGSVKVATGEATVILKPGEQAQTGNARQVVKVVKEADVDKVMAWKNGYFNFDDAPLEEVMRQLERWYDIEVAYEGKIPDIRFGGKLSRDVSLKGLLKSLEETEVHFRIENQRKLIVLP